ncbi:hypothetical protein EVAR_17867_1 [Eumeta japonica]|uniref:Uncharacterized protein n=1 Tax=Eumeta variegata TaxID=151549 RepID=A0A4C1ZPD9_EUMVA|nr:hypothetical protein EVAR_17867_1 [Eumeta japonica]
MEGPTVTQEKREESMKSAFPTDAYLLETHSKILTGAYVKLAMCKITKPEGLCPHYQKLRVRVTRIRGNRRGQPDRSAMEGPRPGGTAFVITVSPTPGKYARGAAARGRGVEAAHERRAERGAGAGGATWKLFVEAMPLLTKCAICT